MHVVLESSGKTRRSESWVSDAALVDRSAVQGSTYSLLVDFSVVFSKVCTCVMWGLPLMYSTREGFSSIFYSSSSQLSLGQPVVYSHDGPGS